MQNIYWLQDWWYTHRLLSTSSLVTSSSILVCGVGLHSPNAYILMIIMARSMLISTTTMIKHRCIVRFGGDGERVDGVECVCVCVRSQWMQFHTWTSNPLFRCYRIRPFSLSLSLYLSIRLCMCVCAQGHIDAHNQLPLFNQKARCASGLHKRTFYPPPPLRAFIVRYHSFILVHAPIYPIFFVFSAQIQWHKSAFDKFSKWVCERGSQIYIHTNAHICII